MDQERDRKRQHNEQFEAAQKRRDPRRQLDAVVSERPDEGRCRQCERPPWDVHMELHLQHVRDQIAKETRASGRSEDLIDQVAPGRHEAAAAPESTSGERVVAAARWHVPGKLGHGVPDKEADDGGEQERKRHVRSGLEGDDRKSEHDVGRRCDVRDALEHQFRKTERIASKLRIRIGVSQRSLGDLLSVNDKGEVRGNSCNPPNCPPIGSRSHGCNCFDIQHLTSGRNWTPVPHRRCSFGASAGLIITGEPWLICPGSHLVDSHYAERQGRPFLPGAQNGSLLTKSGRIRGGDTCRVLRYLWGVRR